MGLFHLLPPPHTTKERGTVGNSIPNRGSSSRGDLVGRWPRPCRCVSQPENERRVDTGRLLPRIENKIKRKQVKGSFRRLKGVVVTSSRRQTALDHSGWGGITKIFSSYFVSLLCFVLFVFFFFLNYLVCFYFCMVYKMVSLQQNGARLR